jgi:hypothetical protein
MSQHLLLASAAMLGLSSIAGAQTLTPNTQHYADRNPNAVGSSGASTLSMRALLGKNGTTDVDVAAGRGDGGAPGNLTRVLFRAYNSNEEIAWSQVFANLASPTFHTTFSGMKRGQPIQTQATIRSATSGRSDVVVTSGNVRLRPDLSILSIDAPNRFRAGLPVSIVSAIREANGDTGATATCRLRVNNVEVDHAEGIWVDAGGTVACSFRHTFDVADTYNLEVVVDSEQPADWDTTNNRMSTTIQIDKPSEPFSWLLWAHDVSGYSNYSDRGCYVSTDGTCSSIDYERTDSQQIRWQFAMLGGSSSTAIQFPITVHFTGTADNLPFADDTREIASPNYVWDDGYTRVESYQDFDYTTGLIYNLGNSTSGGVTSSGITVERYASDITYYSMQYARDLYDYDGTTYFWSMRDVIGQLWPMTGTVSMSLEANDAASHTWTASPSISMSPSTQDWDQSYCEPWTGVWGTGTHCQSWQGSLSGVSNYEWGVSP